MKLAYTLALTFLIAGSAFATDRETIEAKVQERLEEVKAELALSDEQSAEIRPILEASMDRQADILDNYGIKLGEENNIDELSRRQKRKLAKAMKKSRNETQDELADVLSKEQMEKYRAMADARRQQLRNKRK